MSVQHTRGRRRECWRRTPRAPVQRSSAQCSMCSGSIVGDDGDGRGQAVEGAVALVGLHHHPFALAHARMDHGMDDAAVVPWVRSARIKPAPRPWWWCGSCHGSRHRTFDFRRISSAGISARAPPGGPASAPRPVPRCRLDREEITRLRPARLSRPDLEDVGAQLFQPPGDRRRLQVRALHDIAVVRRTSAIPDMRSRRSHEMDRPHVERNLVAASSACRPSCCSCRPLNSSTMSPRRSAASAGL